MVWKVLTSVEDHPILREMLGIAPEQNGTENFFAHGAISPLCSFLHARTSPGSCSLGALSAGGHLGLTGATMVLQLQHKGPGLSPLCHQASSLGRAELVLPLM